MLFLSGCFIPTSQTKTTNTQTDQSGGDYNKFSYQSTYFDVTKEFGQPDKEVSSFPPDAQIPNTMLYYAKQNKVIFVVYEFPAKGKAFDRSNTHYMGTKGLNPESVLHVSQDRFKVMLNAYKFQK